MTEVPEHLLARSKKRRAEMTGGTVDEGGGDSGPSEAAAPATASAAAPAGTQLAPLPAAPPPAPPEPEKPWVEAAESRQKIPVWVMPVLLFLPIWLFVYVGTLEEPTREEVGVLAEGGELYAANCASCHGGSGGGGVGQQLSNGEVLLTFPDFEEHVAWIVNGSPAAGTPYGSPDRPGGQRISSGGMPSFAGLTAEEVLAVTYYERVVHGGQPAEDLEVMELAAESPELAEFTEGVDADGVGAAIEALGLEVAEETAAEN